MRASFLACALAFLAACENMPEFLKAQPSSDSDETPVLAGSTKLTLQERDVEAPEVFNVIDDGLWDGRPSFGGVWVAYPGNTQPERVNIRNVANGKSVVGALFKREEENPGPAISMSSDAAEALGVIAGTPTRLTITALRREPIVSEQENKTPGVEVLSETVLAPIPGTGSAGTETIEGEVAAAIQSLSAGEEQNAASGSATTEAATVAPTTGGNETKSPLQRPKNALVQVGSFASEANANDLVQRLKAQGVPASLRKQTATNGKVLFRVVAGPATDPNNLTQILTKIKGLGFTDAFVVSN